LIDHPPTSQTFFFDKYVVLDRPQTSIVLSTESCKNDYIFWVYDWDIPEFFFILLF